MENIVDKLINDNLNPYVAVRFITYNTEEESKQMEIQLVEKFGLKTINSLAKKIVFVEVSNNNTYLFTDNNSLNKFTNMFDECGVKYELVDEVNNIWNMNIDQLNNILPMEDPCPELTKECFGDVENDRDKVLNILKTIFSRKFDINDVLDKIHNQGMDSLNGLNKCFLK